MICLIIIIYYCLVVWNMNEFDFPKERDVILTFLTNSIIFQDFFKTTSQMIWGCLKKEGSSSPSHQGLTYKSCYDWMNWGTTILGKLHFYYGRHPWILIKAHKFLLQIVVLPRFSTNCARGIFRKSQASEKPLIQCALVCATTALLLRHGEGTVKLLLGWRTTHGSWLWVSSPQLKKWIKPYNDKWIKPYKNPIFITGVMKKQ